MQKLQTVTYYTPSALTEHAFVINLLHRLARTLGKKKIEFLLLCTNFIVTANFRVAIQNGNI